MTSFVYALWRPLQAGREFIPADESRRPSNNDLATVRKISPVLYRANEFAVLIVQPSRRSEVGSTKRH